jgi:5-formaminoimidazole-4-carboxamide-1-beta-D-ribofuranosyl 5'-monophosphate synthetase
MLAIPGHKRKANKNHIRIPPHSCWNDFGQEHKQQQMLVRMWGQGTLIHGWWECKLVQLLQKAVWRLLKKLQIKLPYDPAIPLLHMYGKECKPG